MPKTPLRLFFALVPDDRVRSELARIQQQFQPVHGRMIRPENLHLTMLFLGEVQPHSLPQLQTLAASYTELDFEMSLDIFGSFKRSGQYTLWLGPSKAPEALLELRSHLHREVGRQGLHLRRERFRPHVTLWRKTSDLQHVPERLPENLQWRVSSCDLIRSHLSPQGSRYEIL